MVFSIVDFETPFFLHGLAQSDTLDDHSETTYMGVNFRGTSHVSILNTVYTLCD